MSNSTVVLRNKKTFQSEDGESSAKRLHAVTRPKSWGEFQSNLSAFKSIRRPKKLEPCIQMTGLENNKMIETDLTFQHVTLRRKTEKTQDNPVTRDRPLSEQSVPTPFFNKLNLLRSVDYQQDDLWSQPNSISPPNSEMKPVSTFYGRLENNVNISNIVFTTGLESSSTTTPSTTSTTSPSLLSTKRFVCKDHVDIDVDLKDDYNGNNLFQVPFKSSTEATTVSTVVKIADDTLCHESINFKKQSTEEIKRENTESYAYKKANFENLTNLSGSVNFDSDSSSLVDTGFSSFVDPALLSLSNDSMTQVVSVDHQCITDSQGKHNRPKAAVPTPLRSCYLSACEINSDVANTSKDSSLNSSSSSTSLSDIFSEVGEEEEKFSNFEKKHTPTYNNDEQIIVVSSLGNATKPSSNLYVSPTPLHGYGTEGAIDRKIETLTKLSSQQWNDDSFTLDLSRQESLPVQHHHKSLGTWPRNRQRSNRKQNKAEAEELLRKFRETSEVYRARFRNIYEESRRKIEELMFGLKVAMAKNGYSSKFYPCDVVGNGIVATNTI